MHARAFYFFILHALLQDLRSLLGPVRGFVMSDIVGRRRRSEMMRAIKGKNTKPEWTVRRYLHSRGFRYSLHRKDLVGRPDLTLSRYRTVVFVNGCFWHRHSGCKYSATPKTRQEFWLKKLEGNRIRDEDAKEKLLEQGWRIAIVWECALRHCPEETLLSLGDFIISEGSYIECSWTQSPKIE